LRQRLIWNDLKASVEFAAQVSAVAVTKLQQSEVCRRCYGIYDAKGGLMYEASVGGQQFKFSKL
jgi:hypothetical protein